VTIYKEAQGSEQPSDMDLGRANILRLVSFPLGKDKACGEGKQHTLSLDIIHSL
jgi:hypothetical protein